MSATTSRAAIERLLASATFNAYYCFRVGAIGDGTCNNVQRLRRRAARLVHPAPA